jgi:hypothetical protein
MHDEIGEAPWEVKAQSPGGSCEFALRVCHLLDN